MSNLTSEQLAALTKRVNERRDEFESPTIRHLTLGDVRLVVDVYEDWAGDVEEVSGGAEESTIPEYVREILGRWVALMAALGEDLHNNGENKGAATLLAEGLALRAIFDLYDCVPTSATPAGRSERVADQLADAWPEMPDLEGGVDMFAEHGVTGMVTIPDLRGYVTEERIRAIAEGAGCDLAIFMDKYDLWPCEVCKLFGTLGENIRAIEGVYYCDNHYPGDPDADSPLLSPVTAATLGPEHTTVTPLRGIRDHVPSITTTNLTPSSAQMPARPIGRDRLPDPDTARANVANMLATGSNGNLAMAISQPRTLAEVDGLDNDDGDGGHAEPVEEIRSVRMTADEKAAQLREIIYALQDMAVDGVMPSINDWHTNKPAHLPLWQTIVGRWPSIQAWGDLAVRAKLSYSPKRKSKRAMQTAA